MAYLGRAKPSASVSARVFDKDGKLIADLGTVAGGNLTKEEKQERKRKLAKLKTDRTRIEKRRKREARDGS